MVCITSGVSSRVLGLDYETRIEIVDEIIKTNNITQILNDQKKITLIESVGMKIDIKNNRIVYNNWYTPVIKFHSVGTFYGFLLNGNNRFIGEGFNVLRNSGKTYTMMNSEPEIGLIPRICNEFFKYCSSIEVSYYQIYSEKVYDLLNSNNKLEVRVNNKVGVYVEGITNVVINDFSTLELLLNKGNTNRVIASTKMNIASSRSHSILTLGIVNPETNTISKVNLIDLAGSENVKQSGVTGKKFNEATEINKSLLQLGLVISQLSTKAKHVSYRDSKLTFLLSDSLGGNSKTYLIATVNLVKDYDNESLNTLRFAGSAINVVNVCKVNYDNTDEIVNELKAEIENLKKEINGKRTYDKKVKELQEEIAIKERLISQREKSLQQKIEESKKITESLKDEIKTQDEIIKKKIQEIEEIKKEKEKIENEKNVTNLASQQLIDYFKDLMETKDRENSNLIEKLKQEESERYKNEICNMKVLIQKSADEATKAKENLKIELLKIQQERMRYKKQVELFLTRINALEKELHTGGNFGADKIIEETKKYNDILKLKLNEEENYEKLKDESTVLENKIYGYSEKITELEKIHTGLVNEISIKNDDLAKLKNDYMHLEHNINVCKNEYEILDIKKNSLKMEIENIKESIDNKIINGGNVSIEDLIKFKNKIMCL